MQNKTEKAKSLFLEGAVQDSLKIFRTFKIGFSKKEREVIEIAYECISGNEQFYQDLGLDTSEIYSQAKQIIRVKYNL